MPEAETNNTPRSRAFAIRIAATLVAVALVGFAAFVLTSPSERPRGALIGGAFALEDGAGKTVSDQTLRGKPFLVYFGYTHCPDVCPATIGTIGEAMAATDVGVRAVFVTVDPERDTPAWLTSYLAYLPAGFVALTGSDADIRTAADRWGVTYARVETGVPGAYAMSHTANVYLVDAAGSLRATFPFGTGPDAMAAVLRDVAAAPASAEPTSVASAAAAPTATPAPSPNSDVVPAAALSVEVVSTSVWAGDATPVILSLSVDGAPLDEVDLRPSVQLTSLAGDPVGPAVQAVPVRPPGVDAVSYVATLAIPQRGLWHLDVLATPSSGAASGRVDVTALDPGPTAAIGAPAPTVRTPTLDDVGGLAKAVTTDPAPDLRLSRRSTADALADHQPFVLVIDSTKFRVSPACGRAVIMARYLVDRWPAVGFIHLEPYRYSVITDTPVLDGSLVDPALTDPAAAWGIGGDPWGARSMPWTFVVDGNGIVRAKYQGVMGSADVDVIVSLIEQGG
jgi:protein SCO1